MRVKQVFNLLREKNQTIAFAESITGGSVSYDLVKLKGASKVLQGAVVAYQNQVKTDVLGIDHTIIDQHGVVSKSCAVAMAKAISQLMKSDIGVGITGDAGPSLQEKSTEKSVHIAIFYNQKLYHKMHLFKEDSRITNITKTRQLVYEFLYECLAK